MKENFAIITDAGGDFTREIIAKYGIEETPMSTVVWPDGSNKPTDLYWDTMKPNEYFTLMTNKKNNFSSSIPAPQTIIDRNHWRCGFGTTQRTSCTGYMFINLGKYNLTAGEHTITIAGKSSTKYNLGTIGVFGVGAGQGGQGGGQGGGGQQETSKYEFAIADGIEVSFLHQIPHGGSRRIYKDQTPQIINQVKIDHDQIHRRHPHEAGKHA